MLDPLEMVIYLFGGQDETCATLNDLWAFDIKNETWTLVEQSGNIPNGRSGHSLNLYQNHLVLFGGIIEVTKESNELYIFNLQTKTWISQK